MQTAADLCRRAPIKVEDEKRGRSSGEGRENDQNKAEEDRRKEETMKERGAQRIWGPTWRNQIEGLISWILQYDCKLDEHVGQDGLETDGRSFWTYSTKFTRHGIKKLTD